MLVLIAVAVALSAECTRLWTQPLLPAICSPATMAQMSRTAAVQRVHIATHGRMHFSQVSPGFSMQAKAQVPSFSSSSAGIRTVTDVLLSLRADGSGSCNEDT